MLPQLRRLERRWPRELLVVGVHSPKFLAEQETERLRQAVVRLNVGHPVVNDRDFRIWRAYAVRAWPTLMLVDPEGRVIGRHEGEFLYAAFEHLVAEMLREFDAAGLLDRRPLPLAPGSPPADTPLLFPGKILVDHGRLVVSDTPPSRAPASSSWARGPAVPLAGPASARPGTWPSWTGPSTWPWPAPTSSGPCRSTATRSRPTPAPAARRWRTGPGARPP